MKRWPANAKLAMVRHHADAPPRKAGLGRPALIRWSVQEIRRIAMRLARRRIRPAPVTAHVLA